VKATLDYSGVESKVHPWVACAVDFHTLEYPEINEKYPLWAAQSYHPEHTIRYDTIRYDTIRYLLDKKHITVYIHQQEDTTPTTCTQQ
jgi:hypothetical protein